MMKVPNYYFKVKKKKKKNYLYSCKRNITLKEISNINLTNEFLTEHIL